MCDQSVIELQAHYVCSGQEPVIAEWGPTLAGGCPGTALICTRTLGRWVQLSGPGLAVALNQKALYRSVRTTGPSSVMAIVCSLCAARLPVAVRRVHPSRSVR
jgi:hypothetical protein